MNTKEFAEKNLILKVYGGSIAYGLNSEDSDIDIRGVCIAPIDYYLGLHRFENQESTRIRSDGKEEDVVIYNLNKFIDLAAVKCNPNIIEMLFVEKNHILFKNQIGEDLLSIRDKFLSKKAYYSFGGYAYSQLMKIKNRTYPNSDKRRQDIEKYGFSLKHAVHLVRLLKMGIEILVDGKVEVLRHDNNELLDILRGKRTLREVEDLAEHLRKLLDEAYVRSPLPTHPDMNFLNDWLVETILEFHGYTWNGRIIPLIGE